MNYDESSLEKIRNMEPSHAHFIAKVLNDVYAFFTDENLENDPNKTLEILYKFSLTEAAEKIPERHYAREFERIKTEISNLKIEIKETLKK